MQREERERTDEEARLQSEVARMKEEMEKRELELKEQKEREVFISQQKREEEEQYLREWRRNEDIRISQIYESEETKLLIHASGERLRVILDAIAATNTRPPRGIILFRMAIRAILRTVKKRHVEKNHTRNKESDAILASHKAAAAAAAEERAAYFNSPAFKKLPPHVRTQLLKEQRALSQPQPGNFRQAKIGNLLTTLMAAKKGAS